MSGLIWAGIGRGISDAGTSVGNAMMRKLEREQDMERELRADKRLEDRETRAEERKEAALKRDADIYAEAETAAPGVGDERRFAKFKADLGESALSPEDQRKIFDEQYNQRKVGNFEGADSYLERYSKLKEDMLGEIRRRGGSSGLINQATAEYKAVLEAEKSADRIDLDERKFAATEERRAREFAALLPIKQQTADAGTTRAERPPASGAGSAPRVQSTKVDSSGNMVAIMSDGSTKQLGIRASEFDGRIARLVTDMGKADFSFGRLPEEEKRRRAVERLTGSTSVSNAANTGDNSKVGGTAAPKKDFSNLWK
jgi:hypothetical protein